MKKNYYLLGVLVMLVCMSCSKDENFEIMKAQPFASFREYSNTTMEDVMLSMDSVFYMCFMDGGKGGIVLEGNRFTISYTNENNTIVSKYACYPPCNKSCQIIYIANDWVSPCDSLISNYSYDTTSLYRDFIVTCTDIEPLFYQGRVNEFDTNTYGYLTNFDMRLLSGSIKLENDTITQVINE